MSHRPGHHHHHHAKAHTENHRGILHHGMVHSSSVAQLQQRCNRINQAAGKRCIVPADGNWWVDTTDAVIGAQQIAIQHGYLKNHAANGVYDEATAHALAQLERALFKDKEDSPVPRRPMTVTRSVVSGDGTKMQPDSMRHLLPFLGPNDFIAPLGEMNASVVSGFGRRDAPPIVRHGRVVGYGSRNHLGLDIAASTGTPVYATADGVVESAARAGGYGNRVVIAHDGTDARHHVDTIYAHLSRFAKDLAVGHRVQRGELIGYVGSTGVSQGPHLHYEMRVDGEAVNPVILGQTRNKHDALMPAVLVKHSVAIRLPVQDAGANGAAPPPPQHTPTVSGLLNYISSFLPWR